MNITVVLEELTAKECRESKPYPLASTMVVLRCLCGYLIHPIAGASCPQCGLRVVDVRREPSGAIERGTVPVPLACPDPLP